MRHNLRYLSDPGRILRKLRWVRLHRGSSRDVTFDSWNGRLTLNTRDWFIGKDLCVDRAYERDTITQAMAALEQGGWIARDGTGVLVDIGANIGMITTALLGQGWFARAACFEPSPANLRLLRLNLAQNGFEDRSTVLGVAMSSAPGELAFELSDTNTGDNRVRAPETAGAPGAFQEDRRVEITVPVDTLDHALHGAGIAANGREADLDGHPGTRGEVPRGRERDARGGDAGDPGVLALRYHPFGHDARRVHGSCSRNTSTAPTGSTMTRSFR